MKRQCDRTGTDEILRLRYSPDTFSFYIYRENGQPGIKSNMNIDVQSFTLTEVQTSRAAQQKLAEVLLLPVNSLKKNLPLFRLP